jgi:glutamyl-tRNA synthetase
LSTRRAWFLAVVELFKPRIKRLDQFVPEALPLFAVTIEYDAAAASKHLKPDIVEPLGELRDAFGRLESFTAEPLERALRSLAESRGLKPAALIHATRVAVTGRAASPGLFETLELVGRDAVLERIENAIARVSSSR